MERDKDKVYAGRWCFCCNNFEEVSGMKGIEAFLCEECYTNMHAQVKEMNDNGIFLGLSDKKKIKDD